MTELRDLSTLPMDGGIYEITCQSGTVHVIDQTGPRTRWLRRPASEAGSATYDGRFVLVQLRGPWSVGDRGWLQVYDGSYDRGSTSHATSLIVSIRRDLDHCQICGAPFALDDTDSPHVHNADWRSQHRP